MGPYLMPRHLAICENRKEGIDGVVGESPAIVRERRWARGIIWEETQPVRDVGHGIAVLVNLDLVKRLGRESLGGSGSQRVLSVQVVMSGRMHVHDQDGLASFSRLREGIQVGKVQGVPTREPPVGTGVMVRHLL